MLFIFVLAMAVRIAIALLRNSHQNHMRWEMELVAISLVENGFLGNPYLLPTGPSAHIMPGYPLLLASIFKLFGASTAGEVMKVLLSCTIVSTQYALLPLLAQRLTFPVTVGFAAGLLGAILPIKTYVEIQGDSEAPLAALFLLLALYWSAYIWEGRFTLFQAAAYGALWGAAVLVTAALLLPAAVMFATLAVVSVRRSGFEVLTRWLASVLVFAATLSPWVLRNYVQFGVPIITRSNFGLEFDISNSAASFPLMKDNMAGVMAVHPSSTHAEASVVAKMGEVAYNRARLNRALDWIASDPKQFLTLVAQRIWYTWFPDVPILQQAALHPLTAAGLLGLTAMWFTRKTAAILLTIPVVVFALPYYLLQVSVRYRYPIDFILLFAAVAGVYTLYADRHRRRLAGRNPSVLRRMCL
jgi:hypothetical protein